MDTFLDRCLMLVILAVLLYSAKGCYDLSRARECMNVTPPESWSVDCGVE